jgi:hypothetical protein
MPTWSGLFWAVDKSNKTVGGYTGIHHDGGSNIIIINNNVVNPYAAGIKVGWRSSSNVIVERNTVDRWLSTGIEYNEMISISNTHNSEIRNNHVLHNSLGEAIVIKDASTFVKVYNNLAEGSTVGIYAGGSSGAHDIEIYGNITVNNKVGQTKAGILVANEMSYYGTSKYKVPTGIRVHDNWASGNVIGIGFSGAHPTVSAIPEFGDIEFRNNKSCGNIWLNYLLHAGSAEALAGPSGLAQRRLACRRGRLT